ncbi:interleukin-8-like [Sceloporus undulatus]|uniref:interleukin-8-like n=1 Tax=Sceloporus undulatus TaxID=8520 RepID=UPI001C4ADE50|nr:interleukin-8-like [Sceloporus undulatus]
MNTKVIATLLAFFLAFAALTEGASIARMGSELRCQCINTHSRFIHPRNIKDVKLTQSGPHCKNVEVIATLNDGREVCLEPTANWVKVIIKAILEKAQANV